MTIKFGFPQLFLIELFKMKWAVTGYYLIGAKFDRTSFIHILTFGGFTLGIWLLSLFPFISFIESLWLPSVISLSVGFGKELVEGQLSKQGFDILDLLGDALGTYLVYLVISVIVKWLL